MDNDYDLISTGTCYLCGFIITFDNFITIQFALLIDNLIFFSFNI